MQEERRKYDHMTDSQKIDLLLEKHEELLNAFPYGIDHHKREHQAAEESKQENAKLLKELKHSILKTCVLVVLTSVAGLLMMGANVKFVAFLRGLNAIQ
jgi:hypothetical protein